MLIFLKIKLSVIIIIDKLGAESNLQEISKKGRNKSFKGLP